MASWFHVCSASCLTFFLLQYPLITTSHVCLSGMHLSDSMSRTTRAAFSVLFVLEKLSTRRWKVAGSVEMLRVLMLLYVRKALSSSLLAHNAISTALLIRVCKLQVTQFGSIPARIISSGNLQTPQL
jgi:hypothetical protein